MVTFPIILKGYAIFNPATGLWSKGGTGHQWGKNPKIWSAIGHLKNYQTNKTEFTCYDYSMDAFKEHKLIQVGSMQSNGTGYWNRYEVWTHHSHAYHFKPDDEFFAVVVTINTKAGSTIEAYVK